MDLEKIEKLNELREKGAISEEEYQKAKAEALQSKPSSSFDVNNMDTPTYSMIMHLTQLCCFIVPVLGWVVPLVMWLSKKDDDYVDQQGRVIANWVISVLIYGVVCIFLLIVIIGFFLIWVLVIASVIFTILGAINARDGTIRNYPMAIRFFSVNETPRTPVVR